MFNNCRTSSDWSRRLARYFGEHRPTSTTVEVVRLATDPHLVLELTAVAVVPE
jgi:hypothetical protein